MNKNAIFRTIHDDNADLFKQNGKPLNYQVIYWKLFDDLLKKEKPSISNLIAQQHVIFPEKRHSSILTQPTNKNRDTKTSSEKLLKNYLLKKLTFD